MLTLLWKFAHYGRHICWCDQPNTLRLFVFRFGAFGVNSVLSFYYFLTRSVYNQRAPNTPVLVPDHINEHTYRSKKHFVHSPAYGYPLSLANTECNTSVQRLLALSFGRKWSKKPLISYLHVIHRWELSREPRTIISCMLFNRWRHILSNIFFWNPNNNNELL